jgi:hypothetical protein
MFTEPLSGNDRGIHRHQSDLVSLLSFFQTRENGLITAGLLLIK